MFGKKYRWTKEDNQIAETEQAIAGLMAREKVKEASHPLVKGKVELMMNSLGRKIGAKNLDMAVTPYSDGSVQVIISKVR